MRAFTIPAITGALAAALVAAAAAPASAKPTERRLHSDSIDASSFLWNDWNKFVENYHPNYVADDDPATAWVEGSKGSGAGEWLRIQVTPLDQTTRIRLRVRNGYQKSKDLWKANARAKQVTVRLLPSKVEKKVTLTDTEGWQEVVIDQASGPLRAVELAVGTVYEGSKYPDLCISDVQVMATSETPDNPAFEKSKHANLMSWRAARIAAAKTFTAKQIALPLYPAYQATPIVSEATYDGSPMRDEVIARAIKDPVFAKEWKDALAVAAKLEQNLGSMARAQLAPASTEKLVEVDGLAVTNIGQISTGEGPYIEGATLQLPMSGLVSSLFADQLRPLEVKDKQTIKEFEASRALCKSDVAWVTRTQPSEATGPARVSAIAIGRCAKLEGRGGAYIAHTVELLVYDAAGRLSLLVGEGHIEGYRWATDNGKPMLAGGRSVRWDGTSFDIKRRESVAAK